jgi:hypothetical protein
MDCILLPSSKIFPYDGTDKLEVWSMINRGCLPSLPNRLPVIGGWPQLCKRTNDAGREAFGGLLFSPKQRWTGRLSYINVFNRGNIIQEDFGSLSFSLVVRLF